MKDLISEKTTEMKKLKKLYNKEYIIISIYAVATVLVILLLGWLIYFIGGELRGLTAFLSAVLKPLVLGLVFTYLISPLVRRFENNIFTSVDSQSKRKIAAVVLALLIVFIVIGLIIGIVAFTVSRSLTAFSPADIKDYFVILNDQFSRFWTTIEDQLASMNINFGSVGSMLTRIFSGIKTGATTLLFALIFMVYFLLDEKIFRYWADVFDVFANEKTKSVLRQFTRDADRVFSGYIRGQAMDASIVGLLVAISLLIARVPYAVVIGILTGIGNLVPYVGPVVGFGSLVIVCLAEGSVKHLIVGALILAAVMFIDGNIINPRMLSNNVEVHPVLVIVALLAGGRIGGVTGMLVAVPVAALLKLQFDKYIEKKKMAKARKTSGLQDDKDGKGSSEVNEIPDPPDVPAMM